MTIEARLENWGRAQRGGGRGRDSLTSGVYGRVGVPGGRPVETLVDHADAARVEAAWRCLLPLDRRVLQQHYVLCWPAAVICRRNALRVCPQSIFDLALAHATREVAARLSAAVVVSPPRYVSMRDVIAFGNEGLVKPK